MAGVVGWLAALQVRWERRAAVLVGLVRLAGALVCRSWLSQSKA